MPRNTTKTLGATNGGRGGLAGYTELCESIAQFKIDSVRQCQPSLSATCWLDDRGYGPARSLYYS